MSKTDRYLTMILLWLGSRQFYSFWIKHKYWNTLYTACVSHLQWESQYVIDTRPAILAVIEDGQTQVVLREIGPLVATYLKAEENQIIKLKT